MRASRREDTGASAFRRAVDTSTAEGTHQRGEPQHHGDDGREQPAVPVRGVLQRVGEQHGRADDVGQGVLLGGGVGRTLLGPLRQPAAELVGAAVGRGGPGADRLAARGQRVCREEVFSVPPTSCPAASSTPTAPWDTASAPESSCTVLRLSLPLAVLSDCAPRASSASAAASESAPVARPLLAAESLTAARSVSSDPAATATRVVASAPELQAELDGATRGRALRDEPADLAGHPSRAVREPAGQPRESSRPASHLVGGTGEVGTLPRQGA